MAQVGSGTFDSSQSGHARGGFGASNTTVAGSLTVDLTLLRVQCPAMTQQGESVDLALLEQAKRQTQLLEQINLLLWTFAGVALLAVVLLLIVKP